MHLLHCESVYSDTETNTHGPVTFPSAATKQNAGICKPSLTNFQEISKLHFYNSRRYTITRYLCDISQLNLQDRTKIRNNVENSFILRVLQHCGFQPYEMQVKIIVILFTRGLPYVQYSVLKIACRVKITLLISKVTKSIN